METSLEFKHLCIDKYYTDWFLDYVDKFKENDKSHQINIDIKKEHSIKVLENIYTITNNLKLTQNDRFLCYLAGLYHDIGRFQQYRQYRTFNDSKSKNHSSIGIKTIKNENIFRNLDKKDQTTIMQIIMLHNKKNLPIKLNKQLKKMVNVIRDADKIDIIRIILNNLQTDGKKNNTVFLNLKNNPEKYSKSIIKKLRTPNTVDYKELIWINDFILLILSWYNTLCFSSSKKEFKKRNYINRIIKHLPESINKAELLNIFL